MTMQQLINPEVPTNPPKVGKKKAHVLPVTNPDKDFTLYMKSFIPLEEIRPARRIFIPILHSGHYILLLTDVDGMVFTIYNSLYNKDRQWVEEAPVRKTLDVVRWLIVLGGHEADCWPITEVFDCPQQHNEVWTSGSKIYLTLEGTMDMSSLQRTLSNQQQLTEGTPPLKTEGAWLRH
ncbi:uncharacterized protein LOC143888380 isoform X1 [Tasmannia lanceolata]|uniref:uncharacterized protein LOC143888380 isoform X1 n=1 Tax=Tasmannia lanceolata TaxID=3420 RepID=UPI0040640827